MSKMSGDLLESMNRFTLEQIGKATSYREEAATQKSRTRYATAGSRS
jgi:hypothetical protein